MSESTEKRAHDDAQFEAWWADAYGLAFNNVPGAMRLAFKEVAEKAWKASRAEALEEAAQLIDEETENARHERLYPGLVGTLEECADAIRALAKSEGA